MKNNFKKQLEILELDKVNIIVCLIGFLCSFGGLFINEKATFKLISITGGDLKTIIISIGCSLVASSIVSYLSARYLVRRNRIKEIITTWGLVSIYQKRAEMNLSCDEYMEDLEQQLDIIAFGLRSFRDAKSDLIKNKVKRGLEIRILTINPNSDFVKQREIDEKEVSGQIRKTILDLEQWVHDLREIAPDPINVQIKFYNTLPLDFYFREDNVLYVGPYLYGLTSQQTISFEFHSNSHGFDYYTKYFDKLWNDDNFCKDNYFDFNESEELAEAVSV